MGSDFGRYEHSGAACVPTLRANTHAKGHPMTRKQLREQSLHVVVFGLFALVHPALGVATVAVYEMSALRWKLGPVTIGQWGPGEEWWYVETATSLQGFRSKAEAEAWRGQVGGRLYAMRPSDRVEDLRWDLVFELAGVALGSVGHSLLF